MLEEIRCDKFAEEYRIISFRPGLNTVLGSSDGSNAIGKTTFLQILDYVFGGDDYHKSYLRDIKNHVGSHTIYFKFVFKEQVHYFYRNPDDSKEVCRCDKEGHLIEKISIDDYRDFLFQEYQIGLPNLKFNDLCDRYFRIYGRENTMERYPLQITPREVSEKAVDFLLLIFGYSKILGSLKAMEEELGIKASQVSTQRRQMVDTEKIEDNLSAIKSLEKRLQELMHNNEEVQMSFFGFDAKAFDKVTAAKRELQGLINRRNRLQSQVNALKDRMRLGGQDAEAEFQSLLQFFPQADLKEFSEIEKFHANIRMILNDELSQEISRLEPIIARCEKEIERLKEKITSTGIAKQMSEQVLSQCVQISKSIDRLREQNDELMHQKELQENRAKAEQKLNNLFKQQTEALTDIVNRINDCMSRLNAIVTEETETAPELQVSGRKEIRFGTKDNTSEGTAFKSLVLYDLSILQLCPIPALIHDSNILKSVGDIQLEHILQQYQESGKQVFIAYDKPDSTTDKACELLNKTAVLRLFNGKELFGQSWSRPGASK